LLEHVYDSSFDHVYALAYASTGNRTDADDVTAETYERAVRNIRSYRGSSDRLVFWIYGIARNVVREYRRDRERQHAPLVDDNDGGLSSPSPADQAESGIEAQRLLSLLTPAQGEVLRLRLAGLSSKEIAEVLGKAEGTVKALQFAGLKRLRKETRL
jgi:RNA polymerase sigma-70 factor (ECF subfamily)